jgi:hypothetical protein
MTTKRNGERTGDPAAGVATATKHSGANGTGQYGQTPARNARSHDLDATTEPVLSAEELRALLKEEPFLPPHPDGG